MKIFVQKTINQTTGEGPEGESSVRFDAGENEVGANDLITLGAAVNSGAVSFVQPVNGLKKLIREINRALFRVIGSMTPLGGSRTVEFGNPKDDTDMRSVDLEVIGARPTMCAIVNAPVEVLEHVSALWPVIVEDDLVRVYFVPRYAIDLIEVEFQVRLLR